MKNFRSLVAIAVILAIGVMSCSKGSTGPAGPVGPAGPDSVQYSIWSPLALTYVAADTLFEQTIVAPGITNGILDSGIVLSYIQFTDQSNNVHIQSIASLSNVMFEDYSLGKINFYAYFDLTGYSYRYALIPGSLKTGNSTGNIKVKGYTIQELKAMSYEQVQQVLAN